LLKSAKKKKEEKKGITDDRHLGVSSQGSEREIEQCVQCGGEGGIRDGERSRGSQSSSGSLITAWLQETETSVGVNTAQRNTRKARSGQSDF
jgi:hypothetical protein